MADRKITDLTALAAGSQATGDLLTIVDVSEIAAADKNKKMTMESLFKGIPSNVGIGTSSPVTSLHVDGSGSQYIRVSSSTNSNFIQAGCGSGSTFHEYKSVYRLVDTDNGERLRIDSSGNVGIGTSSPNFNFSVKGSADCLMEVQSSSNNRVIIEANTSGNNRIYARNGSNGAGSLEFITGTSTEVMRIHSSGRVGIGETSPDAPLHIRDSRDEGNGSTYPIVQFSRRNGGSNDAILQAVHDGSDGISALRLDLAGSERMRIDSSGLVGIGTSSAAQVLQVHKAASSASYVHITNSVSGSASSDGMLVGINASAAALVWNQENTEMRFATNNSERMRIDSSGNVGIGATSPTEKLTVTGGNIQVDASDRKIGFKLSGNSNAGYLIPYTSGGNTELVNERSGGSLIFKAANTERMRITSGGNLVIGTSSETRTQANRSMVFTVGTNGDISINHSTSNGSGDVYLTFGYNGTAIGSVTQNGTTAVHYNTTSDYRLKENVIDLDGAIDRVKQLAPKRFNFIADDSRVVDGFLAHEAQTVVPEAVTGSHNEVDDDGNPVYQGIDHSKLVPLLTAALQEAIAEIETLKTKVAALEAG